jgi:hypothetical protein
MAERNIRTSEIALATSVFLGWLPYYAIRIKDDLGLGGRAWTEPGILGNYILHMGPEGFRDCTSTTPIIPFANSTRVVFIHELTHVWQGFRHVNYVWGSLYSQCTAGLTGGNAYSYTPGNWWSTYNVEQQGNIVQDWFDPTIGNMRTTNSRYRYVRDNIRKGLIAP